MAQKEQEAMKKVEESEAQKPKTKIVVSIKPGTKAALKATEDKEPDVSAVPEDGDHADDGDKKNNKKRKMAEEEENAKNKRRGPIAAMKEEEEE
jgi:hypothetical protein